jgi:hypothetical protein
VPSLYGSFDDRNQGNQDSDNLFSTHLIVDSIKEFEDQALQLISNPNLLTDLKLEIWKKIFNQVGIFNGEIHVRHLLVSMSSMQEVLKVKSLQYQTWHMLLIPQKITEH